MQGDLFNWRKPVRNNQKRHHEGPHVDAMRAWNRLWYENRPTSYTWTQMDHVALKHALKLAGGFTEEVLERMQRLLCDPPNAWYAQNATPRLLYSRWNELGYSVRVRPLAERNLGALARAAAEL